MCSFKTNKIQKYAKLFILALSILLLCCCSPQKPSYEICLSSIDESSPEIEEAISAVENYIENFQYRADSDLISSHHIVKIAVSLPATNFHINNILETPCSGAYSNDYSALYNSDYLERNLVAVCTVQKLDFTDENSRLIFERSGCFTYGENQIDFTYVVLRDESGKWQVINKFCVPSNTYDSYTVTKLKQVFADSHEEIAAYNSKPPQASEIDSKGSFAKSCLDDVQKNFIDRYEHYPEVKSCKILSCEIDSSFTESWIKQYWNSELYCNYILAKRFLAVRTVFELTFDPDWDGKSGFGYSYGPDVQITLPVETFESTNIAVYDPDGRWYFRQSDSDWVLADGFPVSEYFPE